MRSCFVTRVGDGEVARYIGRHGKGRVTRLVYIAERRRHWKSTKSA